MTKNRLFPVLYMFVITLIVSTLIIGFSQYTEERVQANKELTFDTAILKVLPGMYEPGLSSVELHKKLTEQVDKPTTEGGAYTLRKNGEIVAYALPIEGQGFWAKIKAVIGIAADKKTITGFVVYEQTETPGLGAEVAKKEFTGQFENLEISTQGKPITFRRAREELQIGQVHAVTGATQTSTRLEKIINDNLEQWLGRVGN
ncbi:MAG: FMN-binding protein [Sedimentisphaerales bacterium]|nr:FMN-binding protein [Sedimentisphaerales bacterium]